MKISKIHKKFSNYLRQPDALTEPEKYLGPNCQDVLNFWIYVDTLSDQEKKKIYDLYWALDYNVRWSAEDAARGAAGEVVGEEFRNQAWWASCNAKLVFGYATWELIGSHKLLEQNQTPTFLPLCIKS